MTAIAKQTLKWRAQYYRRRRRLKNTGKDLEEIMFQVQPEEDGGDGTRQLDADKWSVAYAPLEVTRRKSSKSCVRLVVLLSQKDGSAC